jgi:predicted nucleotidyltransferase component of viral defense system
LEAGSYPTSIAELAAWRRRQGTTTEEARRRLVQFVILASMSSSVALLARVAFKGGNALRFVHGNLRSTLDLDFSAEGDFPDSPEAIKRLMDAALKTAERRYQVKARCQSIHRNPPGHDKTMPTYRIKVCYQFPGDRKEPAASHATSVAVVRRVSCPGL